MVLVDRPDPSYHQGRVEVYRMILEGSSATRTLASDSKPIYPIDIE